MAQVSPYVTRPVDPDEAVLWDVMHYAWGTALRLGMASEAQDIAQEVALRYWRMRDTIRSEHWQPWVTRVTRNLVADLTRTATYRRRTTAIPLHLIGQPDDHGVIRYPERLLAVADDVLEQVETAILLTAVFAEMRLLLDCYRRALVYAVTEHTLQEVAAAEVIPIGTVKSRLNAARKRMRRWRDRQMAM